MKDNILGILLIVVSVFAIPQIIQYQGKLTDMSGIGENDTLDMRFNLYDVETAGDSIWTATVADVPVVHGLFDVDLGPIDLPFDEQYWLEIIVNGNVLAPRIKLTSSPYSFRAAVADSFTGGISPWTQDTMVAHWDSLRGIPADIADGDQIDTTIAHWGSIRDIPADIDDGDQVIETRDTMIAHWDSVRGIPDDIMNRDTIWSNDAEIADTIVLMANAKVHGELIADSIQAVEDNITLDDHIDIYGCANFYTGITETLYTEGFESGDPPVGWEEEDWYHVPPYIYPGDIRYVSTSSNPDGYSPTEGSLMLRYSGDMYGSKLALQQTSGFSTIGFTSVNLNLDMLHDTVNPSEWGRIYVNYSLDGSDWHVIDTLHRVDGSTGWKTETIALPGITWNKPDVFIRLVFSMNEEIRNIHIDNLIVTGTGNSPPHELAASICNGYYFGDGSGLTGTEDDDWIISGSDMYSGISGNVGIGTTSPTELLDVDGTIKTTDFQMTSGASDGYILQSGASGFASWADPASLSDGDWTVDGSDLYSSVSGNIGVGIEEPLKKLHVHGDFEVSTGEDYYEYNYTYIEAPGAQEPRAPCDVTDGEDCPPSFISYEDLGEFVYDQIYTGTHWESKIYLREAIHRTRYLEVDTASGYVNMSADVDIDGALDLRDSLYFDGAWRTAWPSETDGDWTINGDNLYSTVSGNVGIGLSVPESKFVVKNNTDTVAIMVLMGPDATPDIETKDVAHLMRTAVSGVKNANTAGFAIGAYETGVAGKTRMDIKLSGAPGASNDWGKTPDVEVMTLQADGNVGIGTTSPAVKLDVSGSGAFSGTVSGADAVDDDEFVTKGQITYEVGDFAQGGVVFWVDETGQHGLVCAKEDQDGGYGIQWYNGSNTDTEAHGDGIYAGEMNTMLIIANQGSNSNDYAAGVCANYTVTESGVTYGDWYLPSKEELNLMYTNKATIDATAGANGGSGFESAYYWSSSEYDNDSAWGQVFNSGFQYCSSKLNAGWIRAVRRF